MAYKNRDDEREHHKKYRAANKARLVEYLSNSKCFDCGERDIIVLEFDHLPQFEKKFEIGKAISGSTRSWNSILAEINKCDVVCANCHKRRTAARQATHYRMPV